MRVNFNRFSMQSKQEKYAISTGNVYGVCICSAFPQSSQKRLHSKNRNQVFLTVKESFCTLNIEHAGALQSAIAFFLGHPGLTLPHKLKCLNLFCRTLRKFWSQQWDYKYGNCFTFNGGSDEDGKPLRVLKATKAGPTNGTRNYMNVLKGPVTRCNFFATCNAILLLGDVN